MLEKMKSYKVAKFTSHPVKMLFTAPEHFHCSSSKSRNFNVMMLFKPFHLTLDYEKHPSLYCWKWCRWSQTLPILQNLTGSMLNSSPQPFLCNSQQFCRFDLTKLRPMASRGWHQGRRFSKFCQGNKVSLYWLQLSRAKTNCCVSCGGCGRVFQYFGKAV